MTAGRPEKCRYCGHTKSWHKRGTGACEFDSHDEDGSYFCDCEYFRKREEKMKVYLAGPMSGIPEYNYPHFNRVAKMLREQFKLEVVSPAEQGFKDSPFGNVKYDEVLKLCINLIEDVDAIVLLEGWTNSYGAKQELKAALDLNKKIYTFKFTETGGELFDGEVLGKDYFPSLIELK